MADLVAQVLCLGLSWSNVWRPVLAVSRSFGRCYLLCLEDNCEGGRLGAMVPGTLWISSKSKQTPRRITSPKGVDIILFFNFSGCLERLLFQQTFEKNVFETAMLKTSLHPSLHGLSISMVSVSRVSLSACDESRVFMMGPHLSLLDTM